MEEFNLMHTYRSQHDQFWQIHRYRKPTEIPGHPAQNLQQPDTFPNRRRRAAYRRKLYSEGRLRTDSNPFLEARIEMIPESSLRLYHNVHRCYTEYDENMKTIQF